MEEGVGGSGQQVEWVGRIPGVIRSSLPHQLGPRAGSGLFPYGAGFPLECKGLRDLSAHAASACWDAQPHTWSGLDFPSKHQARRVQDSKPGLCGLSPDKALAPQSSQPRWRSEAPTGQDYGTRASTI